MNKYILIIILAFCSVSCNDWLDVRPDTEQKDKDQFSSANGFYDALTGCYMSMASPQVYGERLTMSNIESLANLWFMPEERYTSGRIADWDLTAHDYTTDYSRDAIQSIYKGLFYTIAQANMIIKYAEEQGHVFTDQTALAVVQGEAYAIRAYCQLDVLRLFGQMPQKAAKQVMLPYSFTTSIQEMPAYYDFDAYVKLLKADLTKAIDLLKDNDPVFKYTFKELNNNAEVQNNHLLFRQSRLNYWAVKALEARMHLYLNEISDACRIAKEVIRATGPDGKPVMGMSGVDDFAKGYKLCPNECLFYLSKYDVMTQSEAFLIGGKLNITYANTYLLINKTMLTELYAGELTDSHNRYTYCWNQNVKSVAGKLEFVATTKYYFDEESSNQMLYYKLIPMLRMSEVFLIAMEASDHLPEVNGWYKEYMQAHSVGNSTDFVSLDDARKWIIDEYRREFFAEGQMFYTYKRTGATEMMWRKKSVGENDYILPLPETEYNPNNL